MNCTPRLPLFYAILRIAVTPTCTYLLQNLLRGSEEKLAPKLDAENLVSIHLQKPALRGRPHEAAPLVDPLQGVSEAQSTTESKGVGLRSNFKHGRGER